MTYRMVHAYTNDQNLSGPARSSRRTSRHLRFSSAGTAQSAEVRSRNMPAFDLPEPAVPAVVRQDLRPRPR